jgi:beta-mannosidase
MKKIPLDGDWLLYFFPAEGGRVNHPVDLPQEGGEPVAAHVPGNVELDLFRAGKISDPFFGRNILDLYAYETYEWWYIRQFELPEDCAGIIFDLVLAGVDTLGTIWLNGVQIGQTDNMLIEHHLPAVGLRPGENQIAIRLSPVIKKARSHTYDPQMMSWEQRSEGLYIRKPPHTWGWDIMPRAVSAGIWRSIWLEEHPEVAIEQLYFWTANTGVNCATLGAWYQFRTPDSSLTNYQLKFHGSLVGGNHEFNFEWPVEFITGQCLIPIPEARLWWPKGYGEANLYQVATQVWRENELLAEEKEFIGIRKLKIDRTPLAAPLPSLEPPGSIPARIDCAPDTAGKFVILINDVPVMVKGSNWVPLDAYHSRDMQRLAQALACADDLGCNMLRCWGGNVYEDNAFFDFCDQHGILVWQDFAFACCRYPQTGDFLDKVRVEAESVVRKLRNHVSLTVWCGDNEIDQAYLGDGLNPENNRISREILPQVVHRCDPQRNYVPSSPYAAPEIARREISWNHATEQHLWGPRGYYKSPFYTAHTAHFIGEIGYHGCPGVDSIQRFISPAQLWPWEDNPEWRAHNTYHWRHDTIDRDRIRLMANQIRELFGMMPEKLEDFVLASQITQAEADKFFIESTRRRKWHTSGILWWNVIDGWPQFSDAVVDYFFVKKLAYHYIQRSQQPMCVFMAEPGSGKYLPVVASNDSRQDVLLTCQIWDAGTQEVMLKEDFLLPANQNWQIGRLRTYTSDQKLYLIRWKVNDQEFGNHYLAGKPPFDLERYREWLKLIAALPQPFELSH